MDQQLQKEFDYIEGYLKTYFDEMLIKDIEMLKEKNLPFTLPYIHLISAGTDFLGGLEKGFYELTQKGKKIGNSGPRSRYFVKEWMGRVNDLYKYQGMNEFIYGSVRCGVSHQAIFKENVESYKGDDFREKHLFVRINPEGKERIFIHALQYADDFLKAQKMFREEFLVEKNIHDVYERLQELQKEKIAGLPDLIKNLKDNGYVFQEEISPSPSPAPDE